MYIASISIEIADLNSFIQCFVSRHMALLNLQISDHMAR